MCARAPVARTGWEVRRTEDSQVADAVSETGNLKEELLWEMTGSVGTVRSWRCLLDEV